MKKVKQVKRALNYVAICLFTSLSLLAFNSFSERGGEAWAGNNATMSISQGVYREAQTIAVPDFSTRETTEFLLVPVYGGGQDFKGVQNQIEENLWNVSRG